MPHDKFGKTINPGDEVIIRFRVETVQSATEFCNMSLKSLETMPPYPDNFITLSAINTKQCEKVDTA